MVVLVLVLAGEGMAVRAWVAPRVTPPLLRSAWREMLRPAKRPTDVPRARDRAAPRSKDRVTDGPRKACRATEGPRNVGRDRLRAAKPPLRGVKARALPRRVVLGALNRGVAACGAALKRGPALTCGAAGALKRAAGALTCGAAGALMRGAAGALMCGAAGAPPPR